MAKGGQKDHSGMNKETYDRHYTANKYVGGHHGSPAHMKGSQSDHGQSSKEFADHEARVGTDGHGPSRKSSPLNDKLPKDHPHNAKGEHKRGVLRKSSPANNVSYGTGYIGKPSAAYMNVDPAEAVMSGDENTRQGVKRGSSYKKK
jgi:hypothetical protein